jgi:hypothetical protein
MANELERVCRAIDEALHGSRTDEEWMIRWEWYTNPEHVRLGGPWYIVLGMIRVVCRLKTRLIQRC